MRRIIKHKLDFNKTFSYFIDHIGCGKTLSEKVVERTKFETGSFYTILPDNANLDKILDFDFGGIIPPIVLDNLQYNIKRTSEVFVPSQVITMDGECCEFIVKYTQENDKKCAIIENYMGSVNNINSNINNVKIITYKDEIYYLLTNRNYKEEIYLALRKSKEVWHSLVILTDLIDKELNEFSDFSINEVCSNINFIITGAYDGEGYIFWEKNT